MRSAAWILLLSTAAATAACERREAVAEEDDEPRLSLSVETPEVLDWGGTGTLRITLVNEGATVAEGGVVEVYVPTWLELGTVEPSGTAVTVVSGDRETRLAYPLTDSLQPGERRTVIQQLRVLAAPLPAQPIADTMETVQLAPANQIVRARLLSRTGEPAGAEVQTTLHFVGATGRLPPGVPAPMDTLPPADTARARPDTVPGSVPDTVPER